MKKAFTLIELLAVIIILAIVALIATPIVLNVVDDAKNSAAKSEASMIVSGINNYCSVAAMKEQLNGTTDICKDGVTKEEVSTMVDLGNAKVEEVEYTNSKVSKLVVNSNGRKVTYDGATYSIEGQVVDTPVTPPAPTYAAYSVGDDVTLTDGTTWVVVKDSTTSESEIKLMSTSNVKSNLTNEKGTAMFTVTQSEYILAYDGSGKNSNVWSTSTLKAYLDGTVKTRLEASLNTTISEITIWGVDELNALGCTLTGNDTNGYSAIICDNTTEWYSKVFKSTNSWTKLPFAGDSFYACRFLNTGSFGEGGVPHVTRVGARPVITVSKSVISQ